MKAIDEIDLMVKSAQYALGVKPVSYFDGLPKQDPELPGLLRQYRKNMQRKRDEFLHPVPRTVRMFQNRQMPDLPMGTNSASAQEQSGQFRNWSNWRNAKSTKMMANMNRRLTEDDAFREIMRRRPGWDVEKARRLAPLVAKNYRVDANGNWVNMNGGKAGNRIIAQRFRGAKPISNNAVAGSSNGVATGAS